MIERIIEVVSLEAVNSPVSFIAAVLAIASLIVRLGIGGPGKTGDEKAIANKASRNPRHLLVSLFWSGALASVWLIFASFSTALSVLMFPGLFLLLVYMLWISGIFDNFANDHAQLDALISAILSCLVYFGVLLEFVAVGSSADNFFVLVLAVLVSLFLSIFFVWTIIFSMNEEVKSSKRKGAVDDQL